ncbi:MAG: DUF3187 family protein [Nitrospiria bacterium]
MINFDRFAMADQALEGAGPFPVRNYSPIQLLFLSLPVEKATTLPRASYEVSLEAAESNIVLREWNPQIYIQMKFETFRSEVQFKYGLTNQLEVGLEIPYLDRDGGFLDPFIMSIEKGFSNLNPIRVDFANGSFGGYTIARNGKTILSGGDNQTGPGDIALSGKWQILTESWGHPAIALRAAVKFPTGDFDRAFGSGKPDLGIGLALQRQINGRWIFYLNQNVVFPGGHFGTTDLTLNPIDTTAIAVEYLWTPRFSITGQFDYYTSPFHNTGSSVLDNGTAEGVLGFNYKIKPHLLWKLYAIDNFVNPPGSAADLSLVTNIAYRF